MLLLVPSEPQVRFSSLLFFFIFIVLCAEYSLYLQAQVIILHCATRLVSSEIRGSVTCVVHPFPIPPPPSHATALQHEASIF